ncbi:MAG: hypothetical protein ACLFTQ_00580 [Candidatus Aenigmatarchaeota archaeon]
MSEDLDYEIPDFLRGSVEAFMNDYFERKTGMDPGIEVEIGNFSTLWWSEKGNIDYGGWEIVEGDAEKRESEFEGKDYSTYLYPAVGTLNEYLYIDTPVEPSEDGYDLLGGLIVGERAQAKEIHSLKPRSNDLPVVYNPERAEWAENKYGDDAPSRSRLFLKAIFHEATHECSASFGGFREVIADIVGENFSRDVMGMEKRTEFTEDYKDFKKEKELIEEVEETFENEGKTAVEEIMEREGMSWAEVFCKKYYGWDRETYTTWTKFEELLEKYETGKIVKMASEVSSEEEFFELT